MKTDQKSTTNSLETSEKIENSKKKKKNQQRQPMSYKSNRNSKTKK